LPEDGDHVLILSSTHPVSGNVLSQRIEFKTDSVVPTLELLSPQAGLFPFSEIPIEYKSNKLLNNIVTLLDQQPVSPLILTQLSPGFHNFYIEGQDSSGRTVSQSVDFSVSRLDIIRPQVAAVVLSDALPPELPFEYAAEGSYDSFSFSVDGGINRIITEAPGTEIRIPMDPGKHEIALRGSFSGLQSVKRAQFTLGTKNIKLSDDSLDYQYTNCNVDFSECDVDITATVRNSGDYDVFDQIEIQLDHIGAQGYQTETQLIASLMKGDKIELIFQTIRARIGDTFSLTLDPFARIQGEWPQDNQYQLRFQVGQITGLDFSLPTDNVYFEGVSVFDSVKVSTAGPVEKVEYHVGDWTFIDDTSIDGFNSIVDLSLLTVSNNCVRVIAYGSNQVALDSRLQCFGIKLLGMQGITPMRLSWSAHATGLNSVNINLVDQKQIAIDLARARHTALQQSSTVVAVIQDSGRVVYRVLANPALANGYPVSESRNRGGAPIVGGTVPMPNGQAVFITTVNPTERTCSVDGALPIVVASENVLLEELFAQELAEINSAGYIELNTAEKFAKLILATVGVPFYARNSVGEFDLSTETLKDYIGDIRINDIDVGVTAIGMIWLDFPQKLAQVEIQGEVFYKLTSNGCFYKETNGGSIKFVLAAELDFGLKDGLFNISTGGISFKTDIFLFLDIEKIPVAPIGLVSAKIKVYPQNLVVPLEFGMRVKIAIADDRMYFVAHPNYHVSINNRSRLAKASIVAYTVFTAGIGVGYEYKADLNLVGTGNTDLILGTGNIQVFEYTKFDGSVVIKRRRQYCLVGVCYKSTWRAFDVPYENHIDEGIFYTDQQVIDAVDATEPFVYSDINDLAETGLYLLIKGDPAAEEYLTCGVFQSLTASMTYSPMYILDGAGSCQAVQSPDAGSMTEIFTDATCQIRAPYKPTSFFEYCKNNLIQANAEPFIGNANAWAHDGDPVYDSIGKNTRWTLSHGPRLNVTSLSPEGNRRPFMKKVEYRVISEKEQRVQPDPVPGQPLVFTDENSTCALEMRVFKPDILGQNLKPLMFIHGGSFKFRGFGAVGMESSISHYTERGYIVFAPYHRLMSNLDGTPECQNYLGQAIFDDIEVALQWVKQHGPALGAASGPITLVGQSAGSFLANWLMVNDTVGDIRKSLLFYPPTDIEYVYQEYQDPNGIFATGFEKTTQLAAEFMTGLLDISKVNTNDPIIASRIAAAGIPRRVLEEGAPFAPVYMIHGSADNLVPVQMATRMCDALNGDPLGTLPSDGAIVSCGTDSLLTVIEGANHVLDLKCFSASIDPNTLDYLQSHVESFNTPKPCTAGSLAGAAQVKTAIETGLQWLQ